MAVGACGDERVARTTAWLEEEARSGCAFLRRHASEYLPLMYPRAVVEWILRRAELGLTICTAVCSIIPREICCTGTVQCKLFTYQYLVLSRKTDGRPRKDQTEGMGTRMN